MRTRTALLTAALAAAAVAVGGVAMDRALGVRSPEPVEAPAAAASGAWFCPHGGGPGWRGEVFVANPTDTPVPVRVRTFGRGHPAAPQEATVPPRSRLEFDVPAEARERGTTVEYFGGWVAAGWMLEGADEQPGLAAEPCAPSAGRSLLLPAGTTVEDEHTWSVVMNPFAAPAVFTIELVAENRVVRTKQLSSYVLQPRRNVAFRLKGIALGERTLVARVTVASGRVAAASLGVSETTGGIWSAAAVAGGSRAVVLPGGGDGGRSEVSVIDTAESPSRFSIDVSGPQGIGPATGVFEDRLGPGAVRTEDIPAPSPATIRIVEQGRGSLAAARRTSGPAGDMGAVTGLPGPGSAWVVNSAEAGSGSTSVLYLSNPSDQAATVAVTPLPQASPGHPPIEVDVPAGSTVPAPPALTAQTQVSFLLVATSGTFVPVEAATTFDGTGYAVTAGVPVPRPWLNRVDPSPDRSG